MIPIHISERHDPILDGWAEAITIEHPEKRQDYRRCH
jgi:hypothetical protein